MDSTPPVTVPWILQEKAVSIAELHTYRKFKPGKGHYDKARNESSHRDERRLILSAECQVGKTGAYLHYLKLLMGAAKIIPVPPPMIISEGPSSGNAVSRWLLPDWRTLFHEPPLKRSYGSLFPGKYTRGVAETRTHLVVQSCKSEGWVANYQMLLREVFGETITSKAGNALISKLTRELSGDAPFDEYGKLKSSGTMEASYKSLKTAIDWDGRFNNYGVSLCVCENQCTSACQDALASVSYGTKLSIRTADLAKTGGRPDGVSRRWGTDQNDSVGEERKNISIGLPRCELADATCSCQPFLFHKIFYCSSTQQDFTNYQDSIYCSIILFSRLDLATPPFG